MHILIIEINLHIIRKGKSNYFAELTNASQGDSRKSWRVLNKVLNRGQKSPVFPDQNNNTSNVPRNNSYMTTLSPLVATYPVKSVSFTMPL